MLKPVRTKAIPEFPTYRVSEDGRVFDANGRELARFAKGRMVNCVQLRSPGGRQIQRSAKRLVCELWHPGYCNCYLGGRDSWRWRDRGMRTSPGALRAARDRWAMKGTSA